MAKLPALMFYTGDWLKDPNLRRCSKAAKGVWIDMICLMSECEDRGVFASGGVPWSLNEIAGAVGGDIAENLACIDELLRKGVASLTKLGAISNRRMVRDERQRADNRARQSKFYKSHKINENPNANLTANLTQFSQPSSIADSIATAKRKTNTPQAAFVLPDFIPRDAWDAWIEMRTKMRKKPTLYAMELAVARLVTLEASGSPARQVLDQSTSRNWLGLFEVDQTPLSTGYGAPNGTRVGNPINRSQARTDSNREAGRRALTTLGVAPAGFGGDAANDG